ncbi:histidine kinase [Micromonospora sonchi]|uniref:histidine kinase n=1 Tax=Micromonospora sonchi TaxID=1763543 RepID=A0A917U5D2_9ACTN|nr:sensor domain-containing protein [Micromonospora sonchi]GGM58281.1 histidine kinase [Micromonospora sonchi]
MTPSLNTPPASARSTSTRLVGALLAPVRFDTWRYSAHLLLGAPVGASMIAYVGLTGYAAVAGLTIVGLALLAMFVRGARLAAWLERWRARVLLRLDLPLPAAVRRRSPGIVGWVRDGLTDAIGWRILAFLLPGGPLAIAMAYATVLVWALPAAATTYPVWFRYTPPGWDGLEFAGVRWHPDVWPYPLLVGLMGIAGLVAAAWIVRGLAALDRLRLRWMLRPAAGPDLARVLERRRDQAVEQAGAHLRRIERDLHDGAQVQMVSVAMELGRARRELDGGGDPRAVARHVTAAHEQAKQALAELRDLARGIYPAVLTDLGLDGALPLLAARCPIPVVLDLDVPRRPSLVVESTIYFCVGELLANAAKHSRTERIHVVVVREAAALRLQVRDEGVGGAAITENGGLAGLVDRVESLGGRLELDSPAGGPTTITVELPCAS